MRRYAFTIIELLVAIAIMAVLIALLTPALKTARMQSKAVICSSNIRQISMLLAVYEQQNGTFPQGFKDYELPQMYFSNNPFGNNPFKILGDNRYGDKVGKWWLQSLGVPELEELGSSIFWCPDRKVKDSAFLPNILCGNYGVNRSICKDAHGESKKSGKLDNEYIGKSLGISAIKFPQKTLLAVDSGYALISWQGTTLIDKPYETDRKYYFYIPGATVNCLRDFGPNKGSAYDIIDGRHPNKTVNVAYVDGHVRRQKADNVSVIQKGEIYKNIYPTWNTTAFRQAR